MNYPVWNVDILGGGLIVAIIAIVHMLVSHVAVGGGALLAVAEVWSDGQPDGARIRTWLRRFATWFLVFTTVFGAITGVGIWFAIQLASPEATSLLIHQFVFAWAAEWVMFLGELTVLYLYFYGWDVNSRAMQRFLAVAYFVIAWLSLFIINGILSFMMTPGGWTLENRDIFRAFFNPGFFPLLLLRTVVMFLLAGLFGMLVATRVAADDDLKEKLIRFCAKWVIPAAVAAPLLAFWYWTTLPGSAVALALGGVTGVAGGRLEVVTRYGLLAGLAGALILVGTFAMALRPRAANTAPALALLLVAQLAIMGGEFFREMARKPYVIHGVLYSNQLWKEPGKAPARLDAPYLDAARWAPRLPAQSPARGEWIYRLQCASCHTIDGYRGLMKRTVAWTPAFGVRWLSTMDTLKVMPPFEGTAQDREALAAWVISLHGRTGVKP
ncbi:MAG: cytochrome ubiquinol oxidase subunit I [Deltaproteobacteria bacterium]|nr:cytochrome ubiquinol oxidase subunit I [Deltaproteobacteria bacterium]